MKRTSKQAEPGTPPTGGATRAEIERQAQEIISRLGAEALAEIYRQRVRADRTRRYELPAPTGTSQPRVEIMHTLLGIELKIGRRRLSCPDLSTARYLAIFVRLGVASIGLPYDITRLARLADDLESSWFRMMMMAESLMDEIDPKLTSRLKRRLVEIQREEIEIIGPGPIAPRFNR
ncbi:MAG: hypothetical protein ACK562_00125 [Acidobacteriota bacterium]